LGKSWPALDIHVPGCDPQLQDLVVAELDDFQPTAIQESDDQGRLLAFFPSPELRDDAARSLAVAFGTHLFVTPVDVDDEDWAARSQASLGPVTVGRIVVTPPWLVEGSDPGTVVVVIRPSMGFGTGHHATTRLMLRAMQELTLRDRSVLDIGCGSAVLAISAVLLGASSASGIEIDADALESANENVALNGVTDRVQLELVDFRTLTDAREIVFANLTGSLLQQSSQALSRLVTAGGHLIVSGFMETEKDVVPALAESLRLVATLGEDDWRCAIFRK